ncbi:MAG TPA: ABC transporter substrate-binding protein [Anaerolineaceae bacterium]|nr:ABC transporter substrate-binding protein [Anaerolineaceae bacterium]
MELRQPVRILLMAVVALSLVLSACQPAAPAVNPPAAETEPAAPAGSDTEDPAPEGEPVDERLTTLVVAVDADPANLEPATNRAFPIGSEIIINVFDTLVAWKAPDFTTLEGRLAETWEVSEDGLTYTFHLRPDVKFHDGTEVNAEAVKFSFERTLELNSYMTAYFGPITDITVVDPLTLTITLEKPLSVFLSWLAQPQAAVVSPAAVEKYGDEFNVHPVGSGPFMFESYIPDTEVVLVANPDYWRGAPRLQKIIYRVIPDASTRRLELENGTVDIAQQNGQLYSVPVEDIKALKQNPEIEVIEVPSQIIRQIDFNNTNTDSPVADLRVRQAISYAIDYDGLVNDLLGGTASRVYGPLTENSWGFNPAVKENAFYYDPDKARELLAEAGYEEGELSFTLYSFQGTLWGNVAAFVQANLADVGINVSIQQMEFPPYSELHRAGEFEIALDGRQPWYNDPDAHITIGYHSELGPTAMTFRMPEDPELDQMILEAQAAPTQEERTELYYEIQDRLMEKVPGVYLFSPNIIIYKRANVKDLVVNSAPPLNEYWSVYKIAD